MKTIADTLYTQNAIGILLLISIVKIKSNDLQSMLILTFIGILILIIMAKALLILFEKKLSKEEVSGKSIEKISKEDRRFKILFLTYVTFSLFMSDFLLVLIIFWITLCLVFNSDVIYFNLFFCIFGYKYFYLYTSQKKIILITKRDIKMNNDLEFKDIRRLNDYVFIEFDSLTGGN